MFLMAGMVSNNTDSLSFYTSRSTSGISMLRLPEWDDMAKAADSALDLPIQKALTQKLVRMASDEAVIVPLWTTSVCSVLYKSVNNHNINRWSGSLWTPADTWLSK
jgi:ABC-type transport system substrate-binding protein